MWAGLPTGLGTCFGAFAGADRPFKASNLQQFLKPPPVEGDEGSFQPEQQIVTATKKRDVRRSVQQTAWVTLDGGFAARECLVHDMSATGAKLTVSDASVLSGLLRLTFSRDANKSRQCQVVWRRGRSFGVKFIR